MSDMDAEPLPVTSELVAGSSVSEETTRAAMVLEARNLALSMAFAMAAETDYTLAQTLAHARQIEEWLTRGLGLPGH